VFITLLHELNAVAKAVANGRLPITEAWPVSMVGLIVGEKQIGDRQSPIFKSNQ
jgi:hypothetical protein